MKKAIIATLLSGAISLPAFAANGNDLADANLIFNMDNSQSMELAVLSSEEMKNTEGAFGPWGALSGLGIGAWSYGGYLAAGNSFNVRDAVLTIGGSTLAGAWGGPGLSAARYYGASRTGAAFSFGVGSW
ncbi:MAG: hypothetical protein GX070_08825 [Alcaligenaceae bacterium]|nr:hypothetical protein [Alcaligenaceae bacterium]